MLRAPLLPPIIRQCSADIRTRSSLHVQVLLCNGPFFTQSKVIFGAPVGSTTMFRGGRPAFTRFLYGRRSSLRRGGLQFRRSMHFMHHLTLSIARRRKFSVLRVSSEVRDLEWLELVHCSSHAPLSKSWLLK